MRDEWAVKEARKFLIESGINSLPIDPFKIVHQYGWKLKTVGQIARQLGIPRDHVINGHDSDLWECNGKYAIVYNEKAYRARIPFSIAHEISHIVLGHLRDFPQLQFNAERNEHETSVLEKEANIFAAELLMPLPILKTLGLQSAREIGRICKVSLSAAMIRSKDLQTPNRLWRLKDEHLLKESFKHYLTPVALCKCPDDIPFYKEIVRNPVCFMPKKKISVPTDRNGRFIECPQCGNRNFIENAKYCKICGLYLFNKCDFPQEKEWEHCGRINTGDARYCEVCGAETILVRLGLLMNYTEIIESYGEIAVSYSTTNSESNGIGQVYSEINLNDLP